ncbi:hypothetical protein SCLCIDRAFT_1138171 [Scleroderma citrinum Foug A]|uniref:Uncharacterized protein n=1 Tax=Scleroderma citrinum Foug A TaxID=1036808 RepID=A0A0C3D979_9AGAM|nr:hypothetical protein SCLCIDRAFT_1138171 [Scleroderma citrinum Foug A]
MIPSGSTGMFYCVYILPSPMLTHFHQPGGSDTAVSHPLAVFTLFLMLWMSMRMINASAWA